MLLTSDAWALLLAVRVPGGGKEAKDEPDFGEAGGGMKYETNEDIGRSRARARTRVRGRSEQAVY